MYGSAVHGINFHLVGMPDNAFKESQQRIDSARKNNVEYSGKKDRDQLYLINIALGA